VTRVPPPAAQDRLDGLAREKLDGYSFFGSQGAA
jgi:hypothetical protein